LKKSLKAASITAILLLLIGVIVVAYGNPQTDKEKGRPPDNRPPMNRPPVDCAPMPQPPEGIPRLIRYRRLIANATPTEINGTVVAVVRNMLVLDTDEGHVRIHLPPVWTVNSEVMEREELFNNTFSTVGQEVTVMVLKTVVFENDDLTINLMMGYEIVNAAEVHAYAALPFNIEVEA